MRRVCLAFSYRLDISVFEGIETRANETEREILSKLFSNFCHTLQLALPAFANYSKSSSEFSSRSLSIERSRLCTCA